MRETKIFGYRYSGSVVEKKVCSVAAGLAGSLFHSSGFIVLICTVAQFFTANFTFRFAVRLGL